MVVPLLTTGGSITELPEEVRALLVRVKYCVFGLWFFGALFALFQPINALTTLFLAIFGTFLLSEDPQMAACYSCLRESPIGPCCGSGGLPMLTPFLLFSAVNATVDLLALVQVFNAFGSKVFQYPQVDLLLCIWVCELCSAVLCWRVFKAVMPPMGAPEGYQQLPAAVSGGPPSGPRTLSGPSGGGAAPGRPPAQNFQPFSGQGHRLNG